MQLLRFWREILIIGSWVAFGIVYLTYKPDCPQPSVSVPVSVPVLKEEEVKKKVTKVTKKPSGEVIEETVESESSSKEKSKVGIATSNPQTKSKYSIGIYLNHEDYKHVQVDVGARLGNLPVEAVAGYDFKHKEISVGIRYDF